MKHPILGSYTQCETSQYGDKNMRNSQLQQKCHHTPSQYSNHPANHEFYVCTPRKMCFHTE